MNLAKERWAIIYEQRDFDFANILNDMMYKASSGYGITVDYPQWVEVPRNGPDDYIKAIKSDINPKNCAVAVVLIGRKESKPRIKAFLDAGGVPS